MSGEQDWKPGEIVGVKSGGPSMTVARLEMGRVFCEWFDGGTAMKGDFTSAVLEKRLSQAEGTKAAVEAMKRNMRRPGRI
jgi:uncharacterized protein YodC (DUF2158 family)